MEIDIRFRDEKHFLHASEIMKLQDEYHDDKNTELSFKDWMALHHPDVFENSDGFQNWCKWIKVEKFQYDDEEDFDTISADEFTESEDVKENEED